MVARGGFSVSPIFNMFLIFFSLFSISFSVVFGWFELVVSGFKVVGCFSGGD